MALIIISHIRITQSYSQTEFFKIWDGIINSFYVPLFFILSGVFEKESKDIHRLYKRLYYLFKLICIFTVFGWITSGIILNDWTLLHFQRQSAVWFLITLLLITTFWNFLRILKINPLIIIILAIIGGGVLCHYGKSYFYLGQSLICLPFYAIGYYLKQYICNQKFNLYRAIICASIWLISFYFFYKPQNLSLNIINQNLLTFYVTAIAGSFVIIEISKILKCKILSRYGLYSLAPMLSQLPFVWITAKYILPNSTYQYIIIAIIIFFFTYLSIPIFINKKYNIFKWRLKFYK